MTVESIDGAVELWRASGVVRVRGGAGLISLNELSGRVDISSVSGDVRFNKANVASTMIPSGSVETVGGDVQLFGALAEGAGMTIRTHDGDVDFFVEKGKVPGGFFNYKRQAEMQVRVRELGGPNGDRQIFLSTFKGRVNISLIPGI